MRMSPLSNSAPCFDRPTPCIPPRLQFQPIEHPALPHLSQPEMDKTLKGINETWNMIQKLLVRINLQHLAAFKRQHHFEVIASEQMETMQKDLNLLRGHMNKTMSQIENLKQLKQNLEERVKAHETDKSESVDQQETNKTGQAEMHPGDAKESGLGLLV